MDVLGLPIEEACRRLREAGVREVREEWTAPPRGRVEGVARVVRARVQDQVPFLVVATFAELRADG